VAGTSSVVSSRNKEPDHDREPSRPPESFQLRLNKAAVESLFANDPAARLKLSHDVIEHVVKKCVLAKVESDPVIRAMTDAATNAAQDAAKGIIIDRRGKAHYAPDWQLLEPFKSQVQEAVRKAIADTVNETIRAAVDEAIKSKIAEAVQYRVDCLVKSEINDRVTKGFRTAIDFIRV